MRKILAVLVALAAASHARADSLLLKDGRSVEWKTLTDQGESYDVVTPKGERLSVKKTDVERFVQTDPAPPLTGASFTFDKKSRIETVDLLKAFNQRNVVAGAWSGDGRKLVAPAFQHARIAFPMSAPEEYDLLMTVQRDSGDGAFYVFLPVGDRRAMVYVDGTGQVERGVNGVPATVTREKCFRDSKQHQLAYHVRKTRLVMTFDGKIAVDWRDADYSAATIPDKIETPSKGVVVGDYETGFTITRMSVSYPAAR